MKRNKTFKDRYAKTLSILDITEPRTEVLPKRNAHKSGIPRPNSMQAKMTMALLAMKVGEMITVTYDGDLGNLRARVTLFRKRYPDYMVETRKDGDDKLNIWRTA